MKSFYLLALLWLMAAPAWATHLLGGQIQARNISGNTYEITVVIFGDETYGRTAIDQMSSLLVCLGDGQTLDVSRQSRIFTADRAVSLNTYRLTHIYNGPGIYRITTSMSNRTSMVVNLQQAIETPLTLSTMIQATGNLRNSTPVFTPTSSFTLISTNQRTVLDFRATDSDGDSLVYTLTRPLTTPASSPCTMPVALNGYRYPNGVSQRGTYKLNGRTGELVWDAPTTSGQYSAAIRIQEYRNGIMISESIVETLLKVNDKAGTPSTIPPYEPAAESAIVLSNEPEADNGLSLTVLPNPVQTQFVARLRANKPTTARLQLLDLSGRVVAEEPMTRSAVEHESMFEAGDLPSGVYVLRAEVGERVLSRKVVKQ
ncbi:MAG: T9SS C-terminal target domain-containing protein [Cytophagales bacterium]|nr:MAG: T9SS C-terminal target domain-containing protein [Cytophagales bacterium]